MQLHVRGRRFSIRAYVRFTLNHLFHRKGRRYKFRCTVSREKAPRRNQNIYSQHESATGVYLVVDGKVRVSRNTFGGNRLPRRHLSER
jgi:CRP-like cAMP-binding protein